jgi:hypothetical protein
MSEKSALVTDDAEALRIRQDYEHRILYLLTIVGLQELDPGSLHSI